MRFGGRTLALTLALATLAGPASAQQDLLTREEVEGVLGVSVEVEPRGAGGDSFTSQTPLGSVTIDVTDPAASRMLKGSHATVPDLGDDAFFQLAMPQTVILHVIQGDSAFILSVSYPMGKPEGIADLKDAAKELAILALAES